MNEKYSFKELCTKQVVVDMEKKLKVEFDFIKIPKIQRDYAQGRTKGKELNVIGKKFLDNIFDHLKKNIPMELDFIYGTVAEYGNNGDINYNLLPLDGQQRITTLFLLYWFIGLKEKGNAPDFLKKFTYETRTSSSDFCEYICDNSKTSINISNLPSKELENCWWFVNASKLDPTIKAMINMMDYIFVKYNEERNVKLFERLENLKFYVLPLNGYKLTEDLYIKMNARGKQLTNFENFKADLVKWMRDGNNIDAKRFETEIKVKEENRKIPYYLLLSSKIDNDWINYFWTICKADDVNKADTAFLKFIKRYFKCVYCLNYAKEARGIIKEPTFISFENENDYIDFISFRDVLNYAELEHFALIMDGIAKNDISKLLSSCWGDSIPLTSSGFLSDMTQSKTLIFWGICLYFRVGDEFQPLSFARWMRIVWNIVENTNIDGWGPAVGAIKLLNELSPYSHDIYNYLGSIDYEQIQSRSSEQAVKEEILKCRLMVSDSSWEDLFIKGEKHLFFKGAIGFLLEPAITKDVFKHRLEMANIFFDDKGITKKYQENGHIFLRALISEYQKSTEILDKRFIDIDDSKQHILKLKMAGYDDKVVAPTLKKWFDLPDENSIAKCLFDSVEKDSSLIGGYISNTPEENAIMKVIHEKLYKDEDLQNWMQEHKAYQVAAKNGNHIYVWKPRAWYEWIQLDGYKNEIAAKIMENPACSTDNRWSIGVKPINYFFGNGAVEIKRIFYVNDIAIPFIYKIDEEKLIVGFKKTDFLEEKLTGYTSPENIKDWLFAKTYEYQNIVKSESEITSFIEKIEREVFSSLKTTLKIQDIN
ncbi:GmrSD restriction endonuclease domain-containing protein [Treponema sp. SP13]|uniref:GmrSD restriction endonuclease domain-containing protein n=1 Tax=Treponema sp. SP13 TaxID=2789742 RepID=UPI003D9099A9